MNELELSYINGAGDIEAPVLKDIRLSRDSNIQCEEIINEAKRWDRKIRNEAECNKVIDAHSKIDELRKEVKKLDCSAREPWKRILTQINAAIGPLENQLALLSAALRARIGAWREEVLSGAERESARLAQLAQEKRQEAKYTDDPQKKRTATVAAAQYESEAKKAQPRPEKGIATEEFYEARITNRPGAARLSEDAVEMNPNQQWFNKDVKRRLREGQALRDIHYEGIEITKKYRPKFYR